MALYTLQKRECKVLREYTRKVSAQHTYKDKQSRSGGNKHGKTVKFESAAEEANIMKSHDEHTPKKKKEKRHNKKPKSDQTNADPSEDGRNYGPDRINLGEPAQASENT